MSLDKSGVEIMYNYLVTFYDLSTWFVEGDSSMHIRRKCAEYYPNKFVTTVIQLPQGTTS